MRRPVREALLSAATLALVLLVLVSIDDRVRGEFRSRFAAGPSHQLVTAGNEAHTLTAMVAQVARDQALAHAPLVIFATAATVLVVFMLRT
jgi:hypothetical protein